MGDYEQLVVWRKAHELTTEVYRLTKEFPKKEDYVLTSQLRRAAISVSANIVEGNERNSKKDKKHFVDIARGSLAETDYMILLAKDLGYIDDAANARFLVRQIGKLLWSLRETLY